MADTHETIDGLLAEFRGYAAGMPPSYHVTMSWADFRRMLDRFEWAHDHDIAAATEASARAVVGACVKQREAERERVLAVSIVRSKLYGIAGGLRAITARSDARQRGIHYTEVQNIAAQIENIADNGGEA